ncbi:MAG: BatD family protein [Phycisphaerales bacterium]|nr:BatD family protein [Phycisphaerales bacterium]
MTSLVVLLPTLRGMAANTTYEGTVEFRFQDRTVWVDQAFDVEINVINAEDWEAPKLPEIDGMRGELRAGRESTYTQIINGQVSTRTVRTFVARFTPTQQGIIEIPPIEVAVDGRVFKSEPWRVKAMISEPGDNLLVDVIGVPGQGYVGQPIQLTLNIWIEVFRDRSQRMELSEMDMWSLVDIGGSEWGIFAETLREYQQQRKRPRGQETTRNGHTYYVYQVRLLEHPVKAGPIDTGDIRIVVKYPERITRRAADMRPISRSAEVEPLEILPLPTEGRPAHFTGAVGRFTVRATARPTDAAVGDPITLSYEVTDENPQNAADLANLRPPALRKLANLEKFRIPDDPTTGVVEGRTKVFTETLRPTVPTLTEIPSIPFSFFDPVLERYVTVRSQPIPISVSPSEHLNLDAVLPSMDGPRFNDDGSPLTLVEGTLRANAPISSALLADHRFSFGRVALVAAIAPPIGFAAIMFWKRRRWLHEERPDVVRASSARRAANAILNGNGPEAERVFSALTSLISARMHLPDGALTAREAIAFARNAQAPEQTVEELRALLLACESTRYGQSSTDESEQDSLLSRAQALLGQLDRLRPVNGGRS